MSKKELLFCEMLKAKIYNGLCDIVNKLLYVHVKELGNHMNARIKKLDVATSTYASFF